MKPNPQRFAPQEYHSLLCRIHRRYATTTAALRFGDIEVPFTRVTDPDFVLDQVATAEDLRERLGGPRLADPPGLPYWAELWDSASGIGQYLVRNSHEVKKASVLDLGCGQGLSGCVAAAVGANVLFADLEAPSLLFAKLNSLAYKPRVRTRQVNWQRDNLGEKFDIIIGADILYERSQWEFLEPFWRAHLKVSGQILLGEPGRQTGDLFVEWIGHRGWSLERFNEKLSTREQPIRIFRLTAAVVASATPSSISKQGR